MMSYWNFPLLEEQRSQCGFAVMHERSKSRRQSKRRKRLKMRARLNAMPDLAMLIYNGTNGVESTVGWKTEQHYQAAAAFLKKLLRETDIRAREPGRLEFYHVDTQEQMDAFWDFARALTKPPT